MSRQMNIDPSNQTFSELMSNNTKYIVPRFQRDYSWEQEQWEDLWNDIQELEGEGAHYMGYIVLQRKVSNEFEVIDGQQRLVTLTLLILAYIHKLQSFIDNGEDVSNNKERLELMQSSFIGVKSLVTLSVDSRLTLNRNNKRYFKNICDSLNPTNPIGISKSNDLLRKAFEFFKSKITLSTGVEVAEHIITFTSALFFTKITVLDGINAYKVFETLNARGVMLSTPDLIKNYIFSIIAQVETITETELDELDEKWSEIIIQLGEKNFTDFVRYLYNSEYSYVAKKDLFKSIRNKYQTPQAASTYLTKLSTNASLYTSLSKPHDEWWVSTDNTYLGAKPYLEAFKLFGIKQPNVILLAAYNKFTPDEFVKTAKYLYMLSIRYNIICNYSSSEQEKKYNIIAKKITRGNYERASHIKNNNEFKDLYPKDDIFKNTFAFYKMPSRRFAKKIRFLLAEIEKSQFGRSVNYLDVTLEHICPYNPSEEWRATFGEGVQDVSDRLGNMVLLNRDELKRDPFNVKQRAYLDSSILLTQKAGIYGEWKLASVNAYQEILADLATKTWKVDYQ
ncbi:DUF262 domain-containing protein [Aureispira sp. CCB-QB1]|uniref:DUF262 domain-containing protein n=1 Tax=Aureispira sp. CCB-QB1 TaxID=1313421 RepID=UPI000698AA76|nr:DUF262 domain-containing protein [Aureispira sp. CCB-QB1]